MILKSFGRVANDDVNTPNIRKNITIGRIYNYAQPHARHHTNNGMAHNAGHFSTGEIAFAPKHRIKSPKAIELLRPKAIELIRLKA